MIRFLLKTFLARDKLSARNLGVLITQLPFEDKGQGHNATQGIRTAMPAPF
jgi:hypothetical protein